jgi:hypothetical protein
MLAVSVREAAILPPPQAQHDPPVSSRSSTGASSPIRRSRVRRKPDLPSNEPSAAVAELPAPSRERPEGLRQTVHPRERLSPS